MDMDFGPESEELDDEPSVMEFSTAVGTRLTELTSPTNCISLCVQIRSKGAVGPQVKSKARKATDPPPVHNNLDRQPAKEPEQNWTTSM
jgi:hypothetical protein